MEFELPKINVSFDEEKDEIVLVINGVEKRVKTADMIIEMEKLQEQNTALEQQPCEDCISRKAILSRFEHMNEVYTFASIGDLRKVIGNMPSVQPKPKTGHWIYICNSEVNGLKIVKCSECSKRTYGSGKYCPNCGAKMAESEDKE